MVISIFLFAFSKGQIVFIWFRYYEYSSHLIYEFISRKIYKLLQIKAKRIVDIRKTRKKDGETDNFI